eukprot:2639885-Amphidinium_carterae.1
MSGIFGSFDHQNILANLFGSTILNSQVRDMWPLQCHRRQSDSNTHQQTLSVPQSTFPTTWTQKPRLHPWGKDIALENAP